MPCWDVHRRTDQELALPWEIGKTLSGMETSLSPVYRLAIAFERVDWNLIAHLEKQIGIPGRSTAEAYNEAVLWSRQVFSI